ncbi:MAG: hypothetical protein FJW14_04875 [Acidimicrobiia bacterium]|nr:hypothetical protein [Acidimicrobiia bacterium]
MFGFTVYSSINQAATTGAIPFPTSGESIVGGHAVVAAGFDDNKVIRNANAAAPTRGALLVRNSWGTGWGRARFLRQRVKSAARVRLPFCPVQGEET